MPTEVQGGGGASRGAENANEDPVAAEVEEIDLTNDEPAADADGGDSDEPDDEPDGSDAGEEAEDAAELLAHMRDADGSEDDHPSGNEDDEDHELVTRALALSDDEIDKFMSNPRTAAVVDLDGLDLLRDADAVDPGPRFDDPTPELAGAYAKQRDMWDALDVASARRQEAEDAATEKLGRLQNLLRESNIRQAAAARKLRGKTLDIYRFELDQTGYDAYVLKIRNFQKDHGRNPEAGSAEPAEGEEDLSTWISDRLADHAEGKLGPHQIAALDSVGLVPETDEDKWHKSLVAFKKRVSEYWKSPFVLATGRVVDGDVVRDVLDGYAVDPAKASLRDWCLEQNRRYEEDGFADDTDGKFEKLAAAGFLFDCVADDRKWDERIEAVADFRKKFGHVHIPSDHEPAGLDAFASRVRRLVERDALSVRRMDDLKRLGLYLPLGGAVYQSHLRHCKRGRASRAEVPRVKRRHSVLNELDRHRPGGNYRQRAARVQTESQRLDLFEEKLTRLVEHWKEHGHVHVEGDEKLRLFTYSLIRKLNMCSPALRGQKTEMIEGHDGLRDFLLRKDNIDAAVADAARVKERVLAGMGKRGGRGARGGTYFKSGGEKDEEDGFDLLASGLLDDDEDDEEGDEEDDEDDDGAGVELSGALEIPTV